MTIEKCDSKERWIEHEWIWTLKSNDWRSLNEEEHPI